tara:strand:- start:427 stop:858 length:432 start_codon:yes stop_codon:yes gene_type:complete
MCKYKDSRDIKITEIGSDERGKFISLIDDSIRNVSIIESEKGVIRSNHYHHKDFHYMHVLVGEIDYFYRKKDSNIIKYMKITSGQTIFTPPNEIHSCFFPIFTRLIVCNGLSRDKETYEKDTVRVEFVNKNNVQELLNKYEKN